MDIDINEPVYIISVVSEMLNIPQQTLRIYEKSNLVCPKRTKQNTRLYSQADVEKLHRIVRLHQDLGINLAGIEVILHMRQKMEKMQTDFNSFINMVRDRLGTELDINLNEDSTDLVPLSDQGAHIMKIIDILTEENS